MMFPCNVVFGTEKLGKQEAQLSHSLRMCIAVSTEYRHMTDRQAGRQTNKQTSDRCTDRWTDRHLATA